jgi:hypothetical protein
MRECFATFSETLYSALVRGRQGGWLSPNDCREEMGWPRSSPIRQQMQLPRRPLVGSQATGLLLHRAMTRRSRTSMSTAMQQLTDQQRLRIGTALKQLASEWKDHERELEYFGKELMAKRFHETTARRAIFLSWAYEKLSNFAKAGVK